MRKICRKDKVVVISGSCKGSKGIVLKVLTKENRVIIEGVNKKIKNVKNDGEGKNQVEKEMPIHISNVALMEGDDPKPVKVGFSFDESGNKIRINKRTGKPIKSNV